MGAVRTFIGGVPLTNAASFRWILSNGTAPFQQLAVIHKSEWSRMKGMLGKPQTLTIKSDTADDETYQYVYPLREVAVSKPYLRGVALSDIRWLWVQPIVASDFNVTRRTGQRRLVNAEVIELAQAVDFYKYTAASMDGGKRYTPRRLCEVVVQRVIDGTPVKDLVVDSFPLDGITVQNLMLGENGASAITRAMAHAPGADVYVDEEGKTHIHSAVDLTKTEEVREGLPPPTEVGQFDRVIELGPIRPRRIDVYFTREVELRFDSVLEDSAEPYTVEGDEVDDSDMVMENVIPLPDPITEVNGESVAQGTYVPVRVALEAWEAQFPKVDGAPSLTIANVRKHWFWLDAVYTAIGDLNPSADDKNWSARIATIRQHFRQTYQLPRAWMARIKEVRATRVGILDPFTGYRAPNQAWTDYTRVPTNKYRAVNATDAEKQVYWLGLDKYPGIDGSCLKSEAAPAVVSFVEPHLGILRVDFATDPYGLYSVTHPSMMLNLDTGEQVAPTMDLAAGLNAHYSEDGKLQNVGPIGLAPEHRLAVIVTAVPASPNDKRRLERVQVKPSFVEKDLASTFQVDGGTGPVWELYIPPSVMTAWWAWFDISARETAKWLFGFTSVAPDGGGGFNPSALDPTIPAGGQGPVAPQPGPPPDLDIGNILAGALQDAPREGYVVLNDGATDSHLFNIAKAVAVAQWAAFTESAEGTRAVHMTAGVRPQGNIESVSARVDSSGKLITEVAMSPERRPFDPIAAMPVHTRSLILGGIPTQQP